MTTTKYGQQWRPGTKEVPGSFRISNKAGQAFSTIVLAPFAIEGLDWLGASFIAYQFSGTVTGPFGIVVPITPPTNPTFCLCVSWIDGDEVTRYKLWDDVDEVLDYPLYTGQTIPATFRLECWTVSSLTEMSLLVDYELQLTIRVYATECCTVPEDSLTDPTGTCVLFDSLPLSLPAAFNGYCADTDPQAPEEDPDPGNPGETPDTPADNPPPPPQIYYTLIVEPYTEEGEVINEGVFDLSPADVNDVDAGNLPTALLFLPNEIVQVTVPWSIGGRTFAGFGGAFQSEVGTMATVLMNADKGIFATYNPVTMSDPAGIWDHFATVDYYAAGVTDWANLAPSTQRLFLELLEDYVTRVAGLTWSARSQTFYTHISFGIPAGKLITVKDASGSHTYNDGIGDTPLAFIADAWSVGFYYND